MEHGDNEDKSRVCGTAHLEPPHAICPPEHTKHQISSTVITSIIQIIIVYSQSVAVMEAHKLIQGYKWNIFLIVEKVCDSNGTVADPCAQQH